MDLSLLYQDVPTLIGVIVGVPRCSPPTSWAASTWSACFPTATAVGSGPGSGSGRP